MNKPYGGTIEIYNGSITFNNTDSFNDAGHSTLSKLIKLLGPNEIGEKVTLREVPILNPLRTQGGKDDKKDS